MSHAAQTVESAERARPSQAAASLSASSHGCPASPPLEGVFLSITWLTCLAVGALGFVLPYHRPPPPKPPEPPIVAQKIEVELSDDIIEPDLLPPSDPVVLPTPAPPENVASTPQLPAPVLVAEPVSTIAFALPVEGPVKVVEAAAAAYTAPVSTNREPVIQPTPAAPQAPQRLSFGQGEGRQPAPDYPRAAIQAGQEGTVLVRFIVGENGRVVSAIAQEPSPWPLLNNAAVTAVERRWRFRPGPRRAFEVPIRFHLRK